MPKISRSAPAIPQLRPRFFEQPLWFVCFLALIILAPLPFGSNRPWASDLLGLGASLCLALCVWGIYRQTLLWKKDKSWAAAPWAQIGLSTACFFVVIVWGYLQTTNWFTSGPILHAHPLWQQTAQALGTQVSGSISLTPDLFAECALRILAYSAFFLIAFVGGRNTKRAALLLRVIALTGFFYAFYGLIMMSSGLDIILWFRKWAYQGYLTSTFVNKNSYATYAGLGLLCCLGTLWIDRTQRPPLHASVAAIGGNDLSFSYRSIFYTAFCCLTVFGALILTGSRGGIISACAACFVFAVALAISQKGGARKWLLLLLPAIVFLIGLACFGADMLLDRIEVSRITSDSALRLSVYKTILRALYDNPWQGFGLGSFESAFRLYRGPDIGEWFEHAHNDYLELAIELGLPAAFLYIFGILVMIGCCLRGIVRRRQQQIYPIIAVAASALVGLHSFVDFGMEIPAVAATYAALLGLGVAQSWSSRPKLT